MTTFFTSDPHFGHQNIIEYESRPFGSVEAMNDALVERWNSVVGTDDEVYVLGDVVMGGFDNYAHNIGRLNGYKILQSGNHDKSFVHPGMSEKKVAKAHAAIQRYLDAGFDEVFTGSTMADFLPSGTMVNISHFPYAGDHTDEDRYADARPIDRGEWLVHGHVHGMWRVNGRQINVGVDVWNGYPVPASIIDSIITDPTFFEVNAHNLEWRA